MTEPFLVVDQLSDGFNVRDDTDAIKAAIASIPENCPARVFVKHGCEVHDTIDVHEKPITIEMPGQGSSLAPIKDGFIRWNGPPGIPLLRLENTLGAGIRHARLVGNSKSKPSSLIEVVQTIGAGLNGVQFFIHLEDLWLGALSGYDTDSVDNQATRGIVFKGDRNGDSNVVRKVRIVGMDAAAVDVENPQALGMHFDGLYVQFANQGVRTNSRIIVTGALFNHIKDCVYVFGPGGDIDSRGMSAEKCHRLHRAEGAGASLLLDGGGFQIGTAVAADGVIADTGGHQSFFFGAKNKFQLTFAGPIPQNIQFKLYNTVGGATGGAVRIEDTWGINASMLNFGPIVGPNDGRDIIFRPARQNSQTPLPDQTWHGHFDDPEERKFRVWNSDEQGQKTQYAGPFKVRRLEKPRYPSVKALLGVGDTQYSYMLTARTYDGETDATAAVTCLNAATLDATHVNRLIWTACPGAWAYDIYGRTAGNWRFLKRVTYDDLLPARGGVNLPFWDDNGSLSPTAVAPPATNSTGNALVEGLLTAGAFKGVNWPRSPAGLEPGRVWVDAAAGNALKVV